MFAIIWNREGIKDDTMLIDGKFYSKNYIKRLIWKDRNLFNYIERKTEGGQPILVRDPLSYYGNDYTYSITEENKKLKEDLEILMRGD